MIYFDNAATTKYKPEEVYSAFNFYVREIGTSPGRGSYRLAIEASRMLYKSRKTVSEFFGIDNPSNVVFTKNSTEAINLFLKGFLKKGDHVLISPYEHNAVLRPIQKMTDDGIVDYSVLPERAIYDSKVDLKQFIKDNTALIAITLASNLTGQWVFNDSVSNRAHLLGIPVFVDASQGAGKHTINMKKNAIDFLAFTGHKDLLSLPGVGGLLSSNPLVIDPLIQGGTGVRGDSYINPNIYPDSYESGTMNMPAIWSLREAINFINSHLDEITNKESVLLDYALSSLSALDNVTIYNLDMPRVPTFCFNLADVPSSIVVEELAKRDICVRGGIHCAIKAHEAIGTVARGAVRVSLNYLNSKEEIDELVMAVKELL